MNNQTPASREYLARLRAAEAAQFRADLARLEGKPLPPPPPIAVPLPKPKPAPKPKQAKALKAPKPKAPKPPREKVAPVDDGLLSAQQVCAASGITYSQFNHLIADRTIPAGTRSKGHTRLRYPPATVDAVKARFEQRGATCRRGHPRSGPGMCPVCRRVSKDIFLARLRTERRERREQAAIPGTVTGREIVAATGIAPDRLYDWVEAGHITAVQKGRRGVAALFDISAIEIVRARLQQLAARGPWVRPKAPPRTHCKQGHPFVRATADSYGYRCVECSAAAAVRSRDRKPKKPRQPPTTCQKGHLYTRAKRDCFGYRCNECSEAARQRAQDRAQAAAQAK